MYGCGPTVIAIRNNDKIHIPTDHLASSLACVNLITIKMIAKTAIQIAKIMLATVGLFNVLDLIDIQLTTSSRIPSTTHIAQAISVTYLAMSMQPLMISIICRISIATPAKQPAIAKIFNRMARK